MKVKILTLVLVIVGINFSFCQNNTNSTENDSIPQIPTTSYKVELGETIIMVARKYHVTPKEIYKLNPDAVNGISQNTVLMLPADKVRIVEDRRKPKHEGAYAASQD